MKFKIIAYITLYQDYEAAYNCINALLEQSVKINKIFVLDNSPDSLFNHESDIIQYKWCPNNIGVGYGLMMALNSAINNEYDFLWTFDQDSIPQFKCLETLIESYVDLVDNGSNVGIIAPKVYDQRTRSVIEPVSYFQDRFITSQLSDADDVMECVAPITSGSLIFIPAAKQVGFPRGDFFIDGIDIEYGHRFHQKSFHNYIVPKAILTHNFGEPKTTRFLSQKIIFRSYSPLRHYYICRNYIYLSILYARGMFKVLAFLRRIVYLIKMVIIILFLETDMKLLKIWGCILGTFHGLFHNFGKIWN